MKLIAIIGASACGKDSIVKNVLELNPKLKPVISTTDRPMRKGETQGIEYNFITKEETNKKLNNNEFIETRNYDIADDIVWTYGIEKSSIDITSNDTYIVIVDVCGYKELRNYFASIGEYNIYSFFIETSAQERLRRSITREGSMSDVQVCEIARRLLDDNIKVNKYSITYDYILCNESKEDFNTIVKLISNNI